MNKKGFTLAELMGVIVIIALLALIIIPVVDKQIKEGKTEIYNETIKSIESSMDLFMTDINLEKGDTMSITLYQLKQAGFVDLDIKNPKTNKLIPNDMKITVSNNDGVLEYTMDLESSDNIRNYDSVPKMILSGNVIEYVELGSNYSFNLGDVTSTYNDKTITTETTSQVDTNTIGTYEILLKSNYQGVSNQIIKNVIVKDTTGPTIDFETLNIPLSSAEEYEYKSDIIVSDLSGIKSIEVFTNFGALKGTYSVKYVVTDNYGNETVKYRKVITS